MALVTQRDYTSGNPASPDATVDIVYDNVTGAISQVNEVTNRGALRVYVDNPPNPTLVRTFVAPSNASFNVPASYNMSKTPKGNWYWAGPPTARYRWGTSVAALDASEGL